MKNFLKDLKKVQNKEQKHCSCIELYIAQMVSDFLDANRTRLSQKEFNSFCDFIYNFWITSDNMNISDIEIFINDNADILYKKSIKGLEQALEEEKEKRGGIL